MSEFISDSFSDGNPMLTHIVTRVATQIISNSYELTRPGSVVVSEADFTKADLDIFSEDSALLRDEVGRLLQSGKLGVDSVKSFVLRSGGVSTDRNEQGDHTYFTLKIEPVFGIFIRDNGNNIPALLDYRTLRAFMSGEFGERSSN